MGTEDVAQMMEVSGMNGGGGGVAMDKPVDLACFMGGGGGKAAKASGGGGRRKQSKPIRMLFDPDQPGGGAGVGGAGEGGASVGGGVPPREVGPHGSDSMDASEDGALPCDMCQETFRSAAQLSDHVFAVHKVGDDSSRDSSFLTKYHQLGSELNGSMMVEGATEPDEGYGDSGPMNYDDVPSANNKSLLLQSHNQPRNHANALQQRHMSRERESPSIVRDDVIRNYNKHYEGKSSSHHPPANEREAYNSLDRRPSPLANEHPVKHEHNRSEPRDPYPIHHQQHQPPQHQPQQLQQQQQQQQQHTSQPQQLQHQQQHSRKSTPESTSQNMSISTSSSSSSQNTTPAVNGVRSTSKNETGSGKTKSTDMEDYCEICQKHFCNKYYLKKHKQDVHGIIPDTPPSKRSRTTPTSPLGVSSGTTPTTIPTNMNSMPNMMFLNPFVPIIQAQPMLQAAAAQAAQTGGFPHGIPGLPPLPHVPQTMPSPPLSNSDQASGGSKTPLESGQKPPPSSTSPNGSIPNDALRSMGVLNADAYCELCRKEFCNKYFLKIHKANKHGIYIDEPGLRMPFGMPGGLPPGFENMPGLASLMMPGSDGALTPKDLSSMFNGDINALMAAQEAFTVGMPPLMMPSFEDKIKHEKSDSGNDEFVCKQCNKEFASAYSLKVHVMNVHQNKPQEPSRPSPMDDVLKPQLTPESLGLKVDPYHGLTPMTSEASTVPSSAPGGTMFSNMITAKLADRVTCDVCNKEVCNKYFLKTHKLKVHNIPPDSNTPSKDRDRDDKSGSAKQPMNGSKQHSASPSKKQTPKEPIPNTLPSILPPAMNNSGPPTDVPKPNHDELLKMGIDPEAYCEICKKEFCSKYFLKTHKLNIHGIKVNTVDGRGMSGLLNNMSNGNSSHHHPMSSSGGPLDPMGPMPPSGGLVQGQLPPTSLSQMMSASSQHSSMPNFSSSPMSVPNQSNMLSGPSPLPSALAFNHSQDSPMMEQDWRWKDSMGGGGPRVVCELCNKEVTNKYVLKMHMAQKHGIMMNDMDVDDRMSRKNRSSANSQASSPMQDDGPTDLSKSATRSIKSDERDTDPHPTGGTVLAKTWHVPQEYHPEPKQMKEEKPKLHHQPQHHHHHSPSSMVNEHKCSVCSASFSEVVKLQMHILQVHPGVVPTLSGFKHSPPISSPSPKSHCDKSMSSEPPQPESLRNQSIDPYSFTLALKRKYQNSLKRKQQTLRKWRGAPGAAIGGAPAGRRYYRCVHCQQRFKSKPSCLSHISASHPEVAQKKRQHRNANNKRVSTNNTKNSAANENCRNVNNNKPLYAQPCLEELDTKRDIVMQAFTLRETTNTPVASASSSPSHPTGTTAGDDGEDSRRMVRNCFANSIVCLPVYQRIPEAITVSFTLTPSSITSSPSI